VKLQQPPTDARWEGAKSVRQITWAMRERTTGVSHRWNAPIRKMRGVFVFVAATTRTGLNPPFARSLAQAICCCPTPCVCTRIDGYEHALKVMDPSIAQRIP
jgi:hypothetical protein